MKIPFKVSHWMDGENMQRLSGFAGMCARDMYQTSRMQMSSWISRLFMWTRLVNELFLHIFPSPYFLIFTKPAICNPNCSRQNGYCLKPGTCRCKVGWMGDNCTEVKHKKWKLNFINWVWLTFKMHENILLPLLTYRCLVPSVSWM